MRCWGELKSLTFFNVNNVVFLLHDILKNNSVCSRTKSCTYRSVTDAIFSCDCLISVKVSQINSFLSSI